MLSHRPSNGLYTYNFELDRLRVTTLDSTTSLRLDERDYTAKLVLTLRQFRDAPRRGTKKVASGYLFILHSGTNAIERLDLRKVRQSTSHGAAPGYKIRAEGCGIEFQYICGDGNTREIIIEFRKQDEYERALQILLSQGLSVIIKNPENGTAGDRPIVSGSLQFDLPTPSHPVRQNTASHISGTSAAQPIENPYFPSRRGRTLSIPMPPPIAPNAMSNTRLGATPGFYHSGGHHSPALVTSGYYTPTQSQSQLSEEAFTSFSWPPSQHPNSSFDHGSSREPSRELFQLNSVPGLSRTTTSRPPFGAARYGTPQSFMSSQPCCEPSFSEHGGFHQAAHQHHNHGVGVNAPVQITRTDSDFVLPPTRTLPFKSKPRKVEAESTAQVLEGPWNVDETTGMGREAHGNPLYNPMVPEEKHTKLDGRSHEIRRGGRAETIVQSESHDTAMNDASHLQAEATSLRAPRGKDAGGSPSNSDTELLSIFRTLDDAVERWRTGFQGGHNDLEEVLSNLQDTAQRLQAYLHPSHLDGRNNRRDDGHLRAGVAVVDRQVVHQPAPTMMEPGLRPERRHTREYKQWKDYYLLACRLYETKEERTDPEFIHRFLRGMPGKRALRWVQMGLLHCYPSMVRLSDRRSGTTIVFTKDLRWSHVCEMVTRKLKLPFPKWETVQAS